MMTPEKLNETCRAWKKAHSKMLDTKKQLAAFEKELRAEYVRLTEEIGEDLEENTFYVYDDLEKVTHSIRVTPNKVVIFDYESVHEASEQKDHIREGNRLKNI